MKFLLLILALTTSSSAFAGGGGTVSTECRSHDKTQFIGFEQNISWFRVGQKIDSFYNLQNSSGKTLNGSASVLITENSQSQFNVLGSSLSAEIEFQNEDFGPVHVAVEIGDELIQFDGTCKVD